MSLNFSGYPQTLTPVFNPMYFYLDSTNKNREGFKYIVDIFSASTSQKIATYKLFPRPQDGIGIADVNQILSSQVNFTLKPTINNWTTCYDSFVNYDIKAGEEYVTAWDFDYVVNNGIWSNLVKTAATANSGYQHGDLIYVTNNSTVNAGMNGGVFNVISATTLFGSHVVIISYANAVTEFGQTGSTIYADHRKSQFTGLTSATNYIAFNGAVPHEDFMNWSGINYSLSVSSKNFLTSVPNYYKIKRDNDMWLNYAADNTVSQATYLEILTDNGGVYQYKIPTGFTATTKLMQLAVGPNNLNNFDSAPIGQQGGLPPIKAVTTSYTAHTFTSGFVQSSRDYVFLIDQDCNPKYTNVQLLFLDRMGSWIPANFELRNTKKIDISRETYQKTLGNLNKTSMAWEYSSIERGKTVLNTNFNKQAELTSNWMSEINATFLQELFTSPEVYIKENGEYWPVVVTNTDYTFKTKLNEKLINYTITISYANNDRVQNF